MRFSDQLLIAAEPFLDQQMATPFVQGLTDGTLAPEKLQYWVKVDYPYLVNFSRILSIGVSRAPDVDSMFVVGGYLDYILKGEMASHEAFAATFGISRTELQAQVMGPVKYAYAQHEYATASQGDLADIISVLAPCMFGWQILSKRILEAHTIDDSNPYKWWFDTYGADDALDGHVRSLLDLLDDLAKELTTSRQLELKTQFLRSEYFETIAWSAYFTMETWPHQVESDRP